MSIIIISKTLACYMQYYVYYVNQYSISMPCTTCLEFLVHLVLVHASTFLLQLNEVE